MEIFLNAGKLSVKRTFFSRILIFNFMKSSYFHVKEIFTKECTNIDWIIYYKHINAKHVHFNIYPASHGISFIIN